MADIRIKDLTTTASSTASDDFIAVDGATNGTRKLNAYSPSFGGNATVAGTLTVNGTGLSAFAGNVETVGAAASDRFFQTVASGTLATAIGQNTSGSTNAFGIASGNSYVGNAQNYGLAFSTNAVTRMTISNGSTGGNVSISSTTASTSTSTGALVVSGGLGVAGNLNIGGELQISSAYPAFKLTDTNSNSDFTILNDNGRLAVYDETNAAYRLTIGATGGVKIGTTPEDVGANNLTVQGTLTVSGSGSVFATRIFINSASNNQLLGDGSGFNGLTTSSLGLRNDQGNIVLAASGSIAQFTLSSTTLSLSSTTASTSTSTGALVVSGGVGVAGALYAGGNLGLANSSNILFGTDTSFYRSSAGSLNVDHVGGSLPVVYLRANGSATAAWFTDGGVCYFGSSTANGLVLRTNNTTALTISASQNATFAGNITTAAPAGGTAAAWKLGTVASVSPTSPNRTIEVDIGGTIYYIHAKTTNN